MKKTTVRRYRYVGPESLLKAHAGSSSKPITTPDELQSVVNVLKAESGTDELTATFIVDLHGLLRLAHRRTEHVRCAGGEDVLSAGEITLNSSPEDIIAEWVTNQSTGYCPEPESWPVVERALRRLGIGVTSGFSMEVVFRRCEACCQINIVKDAYFVCEVCDAELSQNWNFDVPCS